MKKTYYELMVLMKRDSGDTLFDSITELEDNASCINIDSDSCGINNAIGIIKHLLKNDENIKGKYKLIKKK